MKRTQDEIVFLFQTLEAAGLRAPFDDEGGGERMVAAWLSTLGHLPFDSLKAACKGHLQASKYWPTPSEIVAHIPRRPPSFTPADSSKPTAQCPRCRMWFNGGVDLARRRLAAHLGLHAEADKKKGANRVARPEIAPVPLVEPPTEYEDARHRTGLVDDDEVVDQGRGW